MNETMYAAVWHGAKDIRLEPRRRPAARPGFVLLRTRRVGICGSDLHYYEHGYCAAFVPDRPFVLGHELTAEVAALGEGVANVEVGADAALDPSAPELREQVRALTGEGFDVILEASGARPALRQAFDLVRPGGTIVQIGTLGTEDVPLPANQIMVREINFVGSMRYGNVFDEAIRLVASGRIDLRPFISAVLPIADCRRAMELAADKANALKVQLQQGTGP